MMTENCQILRLTSSSDVWFCRSFINDSISWFIDWFYKLTQIITQKHFILLSHVFSNVLSLHATVNFMHCFFIHIYLMQSNLFIDFIICGNCFLLIWTLAEPLCTFSDKLMQKSILSLILQSEEEYLIKLWLIREQCLFTEVIPRYTTSLW